MSKSCFFIGHRNAPQTLIPALEAAVERHIVEHGVTEFIVGNRGAFDLLAAQAVRKAKQRFPEVRLTLLLAYYHPLDAHPLPPGFDDSLYPEGMERVPKRAAIVRADQCAIELCEHLIAYDTGQPGNTRRLVAQARRREKQRLIQIENLG